MKNILKVLIGISIIGYLFPVVVSFLSPEILLPDTMQSLGFNDPKAPTKSSTYIIAILNAIPILILIYGFINLFGYISNSNQIKKLKVFAYTLMIFAFLRAIVEVIGTYLMVKDLPVGERTLNFSFDSSEITLVMFALLLFYIVNEHLEKEK